MIRRKTLNTFSVPAQLWTLLLLTLTAGAIACGKGTSSSAQLSASQYDYGKVAIGSVAVRTVTTITSSASSPQNLTLLLAGSPEFTLNSDLSCGQILAPLASCNVVVSYQPTATSSGTSAVTITLGDKAQSLSLVGTGVALTSGVPLVLPTENALVAQYAVFAPSGSSVAVEFGPDASYGRMTSAKSAPNGGGPVTIFVAGMRASSTYHMRARITDAAGQVTNDPDQTFTTAAWTRTTVPDVTATTTPGMSPQPGIELIDATTAKDPNFLQAYATDLDGNLIWGYDFPDRKKDSIVQPIKMLPNGDFLLIISYASQQLLNGIPNQGEVVLLREIDLAGNPVRQITAEQLNQRLKAKGFDITVQDFHHDVTILPNGHWIFLATVLKSFDNLPGQSGRTNVIGDVLIDLDPQLQPVWVWNEFDHLDVNRHPMGFPDWTHSNAVVYSGDGNLLVSIRHQNWVVKVDYANGTGTGNVLWRLGPGGDFALVNGNDPQDWFYAQHSPNFVGASTSGRFSLILMDNGDDRVLSSGETCNGTSGPACYTTVPVLDIDETAKTATLVFHEVLPPEKYSLWGGSANQLANGNYEFDLCNEPNTSSEINEVLPTPNAGLVWKMTSRGQNFYRANRIPSLYPGVQW
jgi:arylsulfate sulfotransferase